MSYFKLFFRFCISLWNLTSGKNFMFIHPVVWGAILHPPFTCKPMSKHLHVDHQNLVVSQNSMHTKDYDYT